MGSRVCEFKMYLLEIEAVEERRCSWAYKVMYLFVALTSEDLKRRPGKEIYEEATSHRCSKESSFANSEP